MGGGGDHVYTLRKNNESCQGHVNHNIIDPKDGGLREIRDGTFHLSVEEALVLGRRRKKSVGIPGDDDSRLFSPSLANSAIVMYMAQLRSISDHEGHETELIFVCAGRYGEGWNT